MKTKAEQIAQIVDDLFNLEGAEKLSRPKTEEFIKIAINGDSIEKSHVISMTNTQGEDVFVVFVLTNRRLIKIDHLREKNKSTEFLLDKMNIEWMSGDSEDVRITSSTGSFGIKDIDDTDKIFFQKVGEARLKIEAQHGK